MKERKWWPFWLAFVLALVAGLLAPSLYEAVRESRPLSFRTANTLTRPQLERVRDAIDRHATDKGARPAYLEELVAGGYLSAAELFDERRGTPPAINPGTIDPLGTHPTAGRFAVCPDVLYFPAVGPGDPGELVMLATLTTAKRNDKLLAVRNNGSIDELTPLEMVTALQRTYTFIGAQLAAAKP